MTSSTIERAARRAAAGAPAEPARVRRGVSPLLLGVAALLALLIALVVAAIRIFMSPPLAALSPPPPAPVVARQESASAREEAPRQEPVVLRPSKPQPLSGRARVVDTATIELDGRTVRLRGVRGEGGAQTRELEGWIDGRPMACFPSVGGRHVCEVDGFDLAEVVLFNGGGRATADASPVLRRAERQAREARRGLWAEADARLAPDARRR
jgi:endonuclease YncB( thermonuclease family)